MEIKKIREAIRMEKELGKTPTKLFLTERAYGKLREEITNTTSFISASEIRIVFGLEIQVIKGGLIV